jgi:hypothetical protein
MHLNGSQITLHLTNSSQIFQTFHALNNQNIKEGKQTVLSQQLHHNFCSREF